MKKLVAMLLTGALALSMIACGSDNTVNNGADNTAGTQNASDGSGGGRTDVLVYVELYRRTGEGDSGGCRCL